MDKDKILSDLESQWLNKIRQATKDFLELCEAVGISPKDASATVGFNLMLSSVRATLALTSMDRDTATRMFGQMFDNTKKNEFFTTEK